MLWGRVWLGGLLVLFGGVVYGMRVGQNISVVRGAQSAQFLVGQNVSIRGVVEGDLFVVAQHLEVDSPVRGDIHCLAQSVTISGEVAGDVRCVVQSFVLGSGVGGELMVRAQNVLVEEGALVGRRMDIAAQNIVIKGEVLDSVFLSGQRVLVYGRCQKGVMVAGREVVLGGSFLGVCRVVADSLFVLSGLRSEDTIYWWARILDMDTGGGGLVLVRDSLLANRVKWGEPPVKVRVSVNFAEALRKLWRWLDISHTVFTLFLLTVLVFGARGSLEHSGHTLFEHPWASAAAGVLVWVGLPVLVLLFTLTVVGIPVAILIVLLLVVLVWVAPAVALAVTGFWAKRLLSRELKVWQVFGVAIILWVVMRTFNQAGVLTAFLSGVWVLLSTGAFVYSLWKKSDGNGRT